MATSNLFAYSGGAKKTVTDPKIYTGGARKDATVVYAYKSGRRELVYHRTEVWLSDARATAWNSAYLAWTDPSFPVVWYELYRDSTLVYSGLAHEFTDSGLAASSTYTFTIWAYYSDGVDNVLKSTYAWDVSTPARPLSTGTISPSPAGGGSGTGNTSSTAKSLSALNFTMPVLGWVTSISFWAHGYSGKNGYGKAYIDGVYAGEKDLTQNGGYNSIPMNYHNAAGGHTLRMDTGGNSTYWTEWRPYSGGSWSTNIEWNSISYSYYAARDRTEHHDQWQDAEGNVVAERVYDKETGELISEFGEIPEPPAEPISQT